MSKLLDTLYDNIIDGKHTQVPEDVQQSLDAGEDPGKILNEGMIAAMGEVGRLFEDEEIFVPEMLISARAMKAGLEVLRPHLVNADIKPAGKIVIGTVKGDLHNIGKNLVTMMLEGAGFEVIDLGSDVAPDKFLNAVVEHKPILLGMSALLTTTMANMKDTIEALEDANLRDKVTVIIGGAPVTQKFAEEIGADLFAADAAAAANKAKELL